MTNLTVEKVENEIEAVLERTERRALSHFEKEIITAICTLAKAVLILTYIERADKLEY